MDKFIKLALKDVKNIDDVLIRSSDKSSSEIEKKYISKLYFELSSEIELSLTNNVELSTLLSDCVNLKKIVTYSVSDNFTFGNLDDEYNYAKGFVETWQAEREKLCKNNEKINSSKFLKFFNGSTLKKNQERIENGDAKFNRFKHIFDEEQKMKSINKPETEKLLREKIAQIREIISSTIDENILVAIKKDPSIIAYGVFVKDSDFANNISKDKNLQKYYHREDIANRLTEILSVYQSQSKTNDYQSNLEK